MKKRLFIYLAIYVSISFLSYWGGYFIAKKYITFDNIRLYEDEVALNPAIHSEDILVSEESGYIKKNTSIIIQNYDIDSNITTDEMMPETDKIQYLGFDRQRLINYISKNPDLYESTTLEVKNVILLSFSESRVVIRRTVRKETYSDEYETETKHENTYYIIEKNGYIVITKDTKDNIFLNTEIPVTELSNADRAKLRDGVMVHSIKEMYSYLESYTS